MKMQRLWRVFPAALIVLAGVASFRADAASAADVRSYDVRPYISPDFCAAIVIHPEQIEKSTLAETLKSALPQQKGGDPTAAAKAALKGQKNLPPGMDVEKLAKLLEGASIRRLVIVFDGTQNAPPGGAPTAAAPSETDVEAGVIVQFSGDVDGEGLISASSSEWKAVEISGHKCKSMKAPNSSEIAAVAPDSHTVIAGHRATVEKMLANNEGDRPLLKQLQRASLKHDILFEFCAAPTRRVKVTRKPSALLASLSELAETAESLSVQVDFSGPSLLHCELISDKPEKAAMLAMIGKSQIEAAKKQFAALKQNPPPLAPPTLVPVFSKLGDEVLAGVEIKADGPRLTVDLPTPASLPDALKAVGQLASVMMPPPARRGR